MRRPWSGDGTFYLPARKVEPYRLWFEFLKCAHADPDIVVDYDHYADWGDVWNQSFNNWWTEETWKQLFAIDASVRVLGQNDSLGEDPHGFAIRVPINKDPRETLKDIQQLLEQYEAGVKLENSPRGKFALTVGFEQGFLKYLNRFNMIARFYQIWLRHFDLSRPDRIDATAFEYYDWVKSRDELIKSRGYKYPRPFFPNAIKGYVEAIRSGKRVDGTNARRQCVRYVDKAQTLARNAGSGHFPGKF